MIACDLAPVGRDCISPSARSAFRNVDELLDFVERIADATGLPVGLKSAIGDLDFWTELTRLMATDRPASTSSPSMAGRVICSGKRGLPAREVFGYEREIEKHSSSDRRDIERLMSAAFHLVSAV